MALGKEIRGKISSIKSTQKITKAMQLVAASKIQKAKAKMQASMPYADKVRTVISHVACSHTSFPHPFLVTRENVKNVGFIVVSSDRGLCGGLNLNLFRYLNREIIKEWQNKGAKISLCLIGNKALHFFRQNDFEIAAHVNKTGDIPSVADLVGAIKIMLDAYREEKLDRLYIIYNEFISTMSQKAKVQQLLPLELAEDEAKGHYWDYIYEPDTEKLLDTLLRRYLESQVYQAVIDNNACEQAARMVAMQNATDNAENLIGNLQLEFNKSRQAAITTEISEIVGGAAAV